MNCCSNEWKWTRIPKSKKKGYGNIGRRWKTTDGESDNFDLLFTYQDAKKQRIWKYRQEDEKQQMVKVTILIYCLHTKTQKATDMEIPARRWKTTDGESDHFDLLCTCHYQFFYKYIYQDVKKQRWVFYECIWQEQTTDGTTHRPVLNFTLY